MVELILIYAVLNVGLGYALAAGLADPPFGGFAPRQHWQALMTSLARIKPGSPVTAVDDTESIGRQPLPPSEASEPEAPPLGDEFLLEPEAGDEPVASLPSAAAVEELPAACLDLLASERIVPRSFAEGLAQSLRLHLAAYRQHALAAESRARLVLFQENAAALEQLVADFRFLHHEWLARLLEAAELLNQRRGRLAGAEEAGMQLESVLYDHAARMESIDRTISEINFKTDVILGCRRLLEELIDLAAGIHRLRDDLQTSLVSILRQQGILADLPHDQRLDPLTGRLNRLGLEASFKMPAVPRQAVLVKWDSFHLVNERLGTRAGDRLLRTFSQLLTDLLEGFGTSAEIVRLTGNSFLLLFDGIAREQATSVAEQVRQSLEGITLDWQGNMLDVAARMGITSMAASDTLESLVTRLDKALDAAQLAGGNRCAVADDEVHVVAPHQVPVIARRVEVSDDGQ